MVTRGKLTLTLPIDLLEDIRALAPPRGQSQFVAEAIAYYIKQKKREALRARLVAGYQETAADASALTKELEGADQIDWASFVPAYQGEEPESDAIH